MSPRGESSFTLNPLSELAMRSTGPPSIGRSGVQPKPPAWLPHEPRLRANPGERNQKNNKHTEMRRSPPPPLAKLRTFLGAEPMSVWEGIGGCPCHKRECGQRQVQLTFGSDCISLTTRQYDWLTCVHDTPVAFRDTRYTVQSVRLRKRRDKWRGTADAMLVMSAGTAQAHEWHLPEPQPSATVLRVSSPHTLAGDTLHTRYATRTSTIDPLARHAEHKQTVQLSRHSARTFTISFPVDPFFHPLQVTSYHMSLQSPWSLTNIPATAHPTDWPSLLNTLGCVCADETDTCFQLASLCGPHLRGRQSMLLNTQSGTVAGILEPHGGPLYPIHLRGTMCVRAGSRAPATVVRGAPITMRVSIKYTQNCVDYTNLQRYVSVNDATHRYHHNVPVELSSSATFERVSDDQFRVVFSRPPVLRPDPDFMAMASKGHPYGHVPGQIRALQRSYEHRAFTALRLDRAALAEREFRTWAITRGTSPGEKLQISADVPLAKPFDITNHLGAPRLPLRKLAKQMRLDTEPVLISRADEEDAVAVMHLCADNWCDVSHQPPSRTENEANTREFASTVRAASSTFFSAE